MEDWQQVRLSQVTTKIGSGATPRGGEAEYHKVGISLIRSQNILDFFFSTEGLARIDSTQASKLDNVTVEKGDVLLNITGDSVARVCQVPDFVLPARVNQHVAIIRPQPKVLDRGYLKYYLLNPRFKSNMLSLSSSGGTRKALTKEMIENFELTIPAIAEQRAIASILSALDDKIELNLEINKTLEEMAMAIYKEWFVDFGPFRDGEFVESELGPIPKGWEVKRIGAIYSTTSGGTPSRSRPDFYIDGTINWLKSKELNNSFIIDSEEKITELALKNSSAKLLPKHTVLVAMYGATVGEVGITSLEAACNQAVCGISGTEFAGYPYVFLYLKSKKSDIINQAVGSAQQNISQILIKQLPILLPDHKTNLSFNQIVGGTFNLIESNIVENASLKETRDYLLPKLVSGEIRVNEVEKQLADLI